MVNGDPPTYRCQATQLWTASAPLPVRPWWDVRQYAADVRSGNVGLRRLTFVLLWRLSTSLRGWLGQQRIGRRVLVPAKEALLRVRRVAGGAVATAPLADPAAASPRTRPGDRVQVRSRQEIEATLDRRGRNRGLSFNSEMLRYCGGEFSVLGPVDRIIDERSGRMLTLRDCLALDEVTCQGDFHQFCPRAIPIYWRQAWLASPRSQTPGDP